MSAPPILQLDDVVKRYRNLTAVAGVSLRVERGECYGLLGPNGAGKTTLFKLITAMARRDGGALSVFGRDPQQEPAEVKARLGVVAQDDSLDPDLGVFENLVVYGRYHGLSGEWFEQRATQLLEFLELGEKRSMPIMALSGGMKRRLMIVRALLNDPECLLLDEPTTGLDPQIRHAIWNALRRLKQEGLTILLTTHYMEEAAQLADRVGIVDHGKMLAEGAPEDLIEEHLPAWVLELAESAQAASSGASGDEGWQQALPGAEIEQHGDRIYAFHAEEPVLRQALVEQRLVGAVIRPTSLEDVFLKLTGRSLRD